MNTADSIGGLRVPPTIGGAAFRPRNSCSWLPRSVHSSVSEGHGFSLIQRRGGLADLPPLSALGASRSFFEPMDDHEKLQSGGQVRRRAAPRGRSYWDRSRSLARRPSTAAIRSELDQCAAGKAIIGPHPLSGDRLRARSGRWPGSQAREASSAPTGRATPFLSGGLGAPAR